MKTLLHLSLFFMTVMLIYLDVNVIPVHSQCLDDQKFSLLHLKKNLVFDPSASTKLISWNSSTDCCSWVGVTCTDGHVVGLDISGESISGGVDNSSSLFDLQHLQSLNLAYNGLSYGSRIPSAIGKLTNLRYLNLSCSAYFGQIPIEISWLTRLVILDLSQYYHPFKYYTYLQLKNPNLSMLIQNLTELTELYLTNVNILAEATEWSQAISSSLPNLKVLNLDGCSLSGPIDQSFAKLQSLSVIQLDNNNILAPVPGFFANFSNLTTLSLSSCRLVGTFPKEIFQLPTLQTINLLGNPQLQGSLPDFLHNGSLQSLFLHDTNFSGFLPNSIGNLKMLSRIDISFCNFSGPIPRSMAGLAQLVVLDLSWNKFNGSVPLFNIPQINLSFNRLTGQINASHWENLTNLVSLDLRSNLLDGTIPSSLFSLPMLQRLQLSNNKFSGQLLEFANFPILDTLDLSSNKMDGPIPVSIFNLRGIKILSLSSNNFSGSFPLNSLQQLKNLSTLDLSYNSLLITYDDTNSSYSSFPQITTLKLASGKLGVFPDFLKNQSRLVYLDLSLNQIHGEIPNWIWKLSILNQLNLSCNSLVTLEGPSLNITSPLSMLDLHSNQLQGHIPVLPRFATYLDYSRNNFSSSIPIEIGSFLTFTMFFSLSSNNFHGIIPESMCSAPYLQVLDLSNNTLSGRIPQCLSAISTIAVLSLRRNNLSGIVPDKFPQHCNLKTLDLNGNHLEGQFPTSLANCTMLEVLNLGNNQIKDTFPCLLKNISTLRVLVLRSNLFYDRIRCSKTNGTWPNLQIVDVSLNNFSGKISGRLLTTWQAMMADEADATSKLNNLHFQVLQFSQVYYQDAVTVTNKGLEMELVKILTVFTSIDISCNMFTGPIPEELGLLKSLYGLNLSSNTLTGTIPSSFGNLQQLESLDLSNNSLSGEIPAELRFLTFLSFLDVSNNQLVGKIPTSGQLQTFSEASFAGNRGLCGPPLTPNCSITSLDNKDYSGGQEINWDLIGVEIGFTFGFGAAIGSLMFCKRWSKWYYKATYYILVKIFPQLEDRIGSHRRHVHINPSWMRG